jgi:hypothetical protein
VPSAERRAIKRRVPLGKAIIWSETEIDRLCSIKPRDLKLANLWWRKHAPAKYRRLLNAQKPDPNQ